MNAHLYGLIQSHAPAEYAAGADVEVCAILNTPSIRHADATLRTARWLIAELGAEAAGVILATLQASAHPIIRAGYDSFCSTGLDLSHDTTQLMIATVGAAAGWPVELIAELRSRGVWHTSPAGESYGRDVTPEDVAGARAWHGLTRRAADAYNATVAAIEVGDAEDWSQVVAVFGATE